MTQLRVEMHSFYITWQDIQKFSKRYSKNWMLFSATILRNLRPCKIWTICTTWNWSSRRRFVFIHQLLLSEESLARKSHSAILPSQKTRASQYLPFSWAETLNFIRTLFISIQWDSMLKETTRRTIHTLTFPSQRGQEIASDRNLLCSKWKA